MYKKVLILSIVCSLLGACGGPNTRESIHPTKKIHDKAEKKGGEGADKAKEEDPTMGFSTMECGDKKILNAAALVNKFFGEKATDKDKMAVKYLAYMSGYRLPTKGQPLSRADVELDVKNWKESYLLQNGLDLQTGTARQISEKIPALSVSKQSCEQIVILAAKGDDLLDSTGGEEKANNANQPRITFTVVLAESDDNKLKLLSEDGEELTFLTMSDSSIAIISKRKHVMSICGKESSLVLKRSMLFEWGELVNGEVNLTPEVYTSLKNIIGNQNILENATGKNFNEEKEVASYMLRTDVAQLFEEERSLAQDGLIDGPSPNSQLRINLSCE